MKSTLGLGAPKINFSWIRKVPLMIASHAFLIILASIFIYTIVGVALFYQYTQAITVQAGETTSSNASFDNAGYQAILKIWQANQQNLQQNASQTYSNPFQ